MEPLAFPRGGATLSVEQKRRIARIALGLVPTDDAEQLEFRSNLKTGTYRLVLRDGSAVGKLRKSAVIDALNHGTNITLDVDLESVDAGGDSDRAELVVVRRD